LRLAGGKRMRAAELLGISRHNLWEKLVAHGLSNWEADE
jgi:transcriptional regulator of acetoin/glycerol metabolism